MANESGQGKGPASLTADPFRRSFVARFGEADAKAIEDAAQAHYAHGEALGFDFGLPGPHSTDDFGSSPFRYWFLLAIGHQCVSRFRDYHGIAATEADLRAWALAEGELAEHDGAVPDYIALVAGLYEGWLVTDE